MTAAEQLHGDALARAYGFAIEPRRSRRIEMYAPGEEPSERDEWLDEVQRWEGEERARLARERRERRERERTYVERTCATCGWDVRAAADATHAECDAWSPCRGALRALEPLEHGDDCDCARCRSDLEETATEGQCEACGASPLGGPGDEEGLCRDCARAIREIERERVVG